MSPQQTAMIEALKRRGIDKVVVQPMNLIELEYAKATLDRRPQGDFTATLDQLRAYYERQAK